MLFEILVVVAMVGTVCLVVFLALRYLKIFLLYQTRQEILNMHTLGKTEKEIANYLGLSIESVQLHKKKLNM